MRRVRVKICGVRDLREAEAAIEAGVDAVGFNFWEKSPRYISPVAAREIAERLFPLAAIVGVFVNEDPSVIKETAARVGLSAIQLHGDEPPEICQRLGPTRVIKALRVGDDFDPESIRSYPVSAVLLDASVRGSYGGTGKQFNWQIARQACRIAPVILAGGIAIDNVGQAITEVGPYGIDVCSGVESEPGRKDVAKIKGFMAEVNRWNNSAGSGSDRNIGCR